MRILRVAVTIGQTRATFWGKWVVSSLYHLYLSSFPPNPAGMFQPSISVAAVISQFEHSFGSERAPQNLPGFGHFTHWEDTTWRQFPHSWTNRKRTLHLGRVTHADPIHGLSGYPPFLLVFSGGIWHFFRGVGQIGQEYWILDAWFSGFEGLRDPY